MTPPAAPAPAFDREKAAAFVEQLKSSYQGAVLTMLVDLGRRLGLLDAIATGPATAAELATRVDCGERHVREWCGGMAVAGVLAYDPVTHVFTMPPEHALWLTGTRHTNLAHMAGLIAGLAPRADDVEAAFRSNGGVPYDKYRPHFTHAMDSVGRAKYDAMLVSAYLPQAPGLTERLSAGVDVLDVGCGTGHCLNIMAKAFPNSRFTGYDFSSEAIELARAEAAAMGLANASFEVHDVTTLPTACADVVFAFDAIHDQTDPQGVLDQIRSALRDGGELFMVDIKASSNLEDNLGDPLKLVLYGTSVFHCMQVSLAGGGPGLGTMWGTELATAMLLEAGFEHVSVHDIDGDPSNCIYVCHL